MSCISGKYEPAVGILLQVAILKESPVENGMPATPELRLDQALVDTGASCTCISQKVASEVDLQPLGKEPMNTPGGEVAQNTYQFFVGFIISPKQEPTGVFTGNIALHSVKGAEFQNDGMEFDVLLGRDVICKGGLTLSFDGHYMLSF